MMTSAAPEKQGCRYELVGLPAKIHKDRGNQLCRIVGSTRVPLNGAGQADLIEDEDED
jgi:hypothetical protein